MKGNNYVNASENSEVEITKETFTKITVRSNDFAEQYLETTDCNKPQFNRLVSWFIIFSVIPENSDGWAPSLNKIISEYLKDSQSVSLDVEKLKEDLPDIIPRDLSRSFKLLHELSEDLQIKEEFFDNAFGRIHRIFYFLDKKVDEFDYLQGYDRFIYYCTCVACSFCIQTGLNANVAEALAFNLSKEFILKVSIADTVIDPSHSKDIMYELSAYINSSSGVTASALKSQNLNPNMYALNFLLLLFSEQHDPVETLIIWDLIILHIKDKMKYIYSLCTAHLVQCQIGGTTAETLQRITKMREYNFTRIINETKRFYERKPISQITTERSGNIPPGYIVIGLIIVFTLVGVIFYKSLDL